MASPPRERYVTARLCLEWLSTQGAALPLGRFRAPKTGWLVLQHGSGHVLHCNELRAYDLATGAVFATRECALPEHGLELDADGFVDEKPTEAHFKRQTLTGRVPVDALREVALMLLLSSYVQDHVVPSAIRYRLPGAIVPRRPKEETVVPRVRPGAVRTSAQTAVDWIWSVTGAMGGAPTPRAIRASGTFVWRSASRMADSYLEHLVTALEASLEPGCVPAHAPADLLSTGALDASMERLAAAFVRLRAAPLCMGGGRP